MTKEEFESFSTNVIYIHFVIFKVDPLFSFSYRALMNDTGKTFCRLEQPVVNMLDKCF